MCVCVLNGGVVTSCFVLTDSAPSGEALNC